MFGIRTRRKNIEARVARGMALLDRARPGWHRRINLDRLDIADGRRCALGQTYGMYGWGVDRLGLSRGTSASHGFNANYVVPVTTRTEYNRLTAEWRRQIETRLDAEREQWANDPKIMRRRHLIRR